MRQTKTLLLFILFSLTSLSIFSQSYIVSGVITDAADGTTIIGASVIIKGTNKGALSDFNGKYSIDVGDNSNATLKFSYVGYKDVEIEVASREKINVALEIKDEQLNEVVITALGLKRDKKVLNYAIQEIKSEDISNSKQENIVNSLNGKIAGVFVTNSSGTPGASSQILIRGANSVSDAVDNQPLFVVDGIPIDNSASFNGGNRAMDINSSDIESVTVLKGPTAAALYGLEAANGAIIITTKSGKEGVTNIDFSASFGAEDAVRLPKRQTDYKQGYRGIYDPESRSSWGPLFSKNDKKYENIGNFLKPGLKQKYDLSVSTGSEKANVYISTNYLTQEGIFPGENYRRYGVLLKGKAKLNSKISLNLSSNLIRSHNRRGGLGRMYNVYNWPINNDMSKYYNPDGSKNWLIPRAEGYEWNNPENPYWMSENNPNTDDVNHTLTMGSINYAITDNLKAVYRIGTDITNQFYKSITSPESAGSAERYKGIIIEKDRSFIKTNSTFLLTYDKKLGGGFNLSALIGNDIKDTKSKLTIIDGRKYRNPDLDNINNLEDIKATQYLSRKRLVGVFADVKFDYRSTIFLGVTGRNDWSSTLPKSNNSFFYPSVSLGIDLSKFLPSDNILSYGKLRANWAQVGKDAPPHRLTAVLKSTQTIGGGFKYDYYAGNPNLKPETTESWEVGTDLRFFKGKTRIDFTYYSMKSIDQIIQSRISPASGWVILVFNSGSIENKGIELILSQKLFDKRSFNWEISSNISRNISKLKELPSFVSKYPVTYGQLLNEARPSSVLGHPLMAIEGTKYLRNDKGELVLDEYGYPRIGTYVKDDKGNYVFDKNGMIKVDNQSVFIGNREPEYIIGLTNDVSYKAFSLSFMFDFRIGGDVLNLTKAFMLSRGTDGSLEEHRNQSTVFNGVVETGDGNFDINDKKVILDQSFYNAYYLHAGENFVEDASWTRLRYISLNYDLPKFLAGKLGLKNLNISVTGRNLFLLTKYSGGDPETNYFGSGLGGTGTAGLDYFNVPATRGIEFTLKSSF